MKLKAILLIFISVLVVACGGRPAPTDATVIADAGKPNIIMIVIDDLGWSDVGYNQTTDHFETPNIDALAQQGLVFDQAYAGAANCAPSRAVLMSGQ